MLKCTFCKKRVPKDHATIAVSSTGVAIRPDQLGRIPIDKNATYAPVCRKCGAPYQKQFEADFEAARRELEAEGKINMERESQDDFIDSQEWDSQEDWLVHVQALASFLKDDAVKHKRLDTWVMGLEEACQ